MTQASIDDWLTARYGLDTDGDRGRRHAVALHSSPVFMTFLLLAIVLLLFGPVLVSFGAVTAAVVDGADYLIAAPRWTTLELVLYQLFVGFAVVLVSEAVRIGIPHVHWIHEDPGMPRISWIHGAEEDGDLFTFYWRRKLCAIPSEFVARRLNRFVFKGSWKVIRYPGAEFDLVWIPATRTLSDGEAREEIRQAGLRRGRRHERETRFSGDREAEGRA